VNDSVDEWFTETPSGEVVLVLRPTDSNTLQWVRIGGSEQ
jgi:hypothetical protein